MIGVDVERAAMMVTGGRQRRRGRLGLHTAGQRVAPLSVLRAYTEAFRFLGRSGACEFVHKRPLPEHITPSR